MKKSLLAIITLSVFLGACGKNIDMDNAATDVAVVEDTVSEDITVAAKTGEDKADEALSNVRELEKGAHTDDKPDVAPAIEDMDPLYKKFFKGEMVASTKYADWPMVSINDYKEDAIMWYVENAGMRYCLLDVNSDGNDELVMYTGFDGTFKMYVISSDGNELKCYDFFDIKTRQDRFDLYDNGVFSFGETLSENEERYFTYDENGEKKQLITFCKDRERHSGLIYDYYYLNGDENDIHILSSDWEYERIASEYIGNSVEYTDCTDYVKYYQ